MTLLKPGDKYNCIVLKNYSYFANQKEWEARLEALLNLAQNPTKKDKRTLVEFIEKYK